jgi:L-ascorbate metabolism protein UlaG (beta-lactamase superfamily)
MRYFHSMNYPSDHYNGRIFLNPVPTAVMKKGAGARLIRQLFQLHPGRNPLHPPGPFYADPALFNHIPSNTVRITWLGHSSLILEIDGKRLLIDPLWYNRVSPFTLIGPKRFFANPIAIDDLPPIDALLLSHDHYDHLDKAAVKKLAAKGVPIITMLGVGNRLVKWGIDKTIIIELDWWQSLPLDNHFTITAAPTRHFSGRWLTDRFRTLWGSFAIKGPLHNVYFGADSGYYNGFTTIGERLGPFDLTMLEIGAYGDEWPAIHMGPEHAVQAHIDLQGKLLMPIHWGTFNLAFHPWKEPVERVLPAAAQKDIPLLLPTPGVTYDIQNGPWISNWWQK